jgi:CIC family chloride channel protein
MLRNSTSGSTTDGLTVSPALDIVTQSAQVPRYHATVDRRVVWLTAVSIVLGCGAALLAQVLVALIALITNVSYFGEVSLEHRAPAEAVPNLGLISIVIPVVGALIIGLLARYGSKAIRGHGIPEAMEQVLTNESRIPARVTFLKPLSSAVSIGTGGPFGAEGPIIATGGALGSVLGQFLRVTTAERKTLLAAGAAAGMAATFGSPVSAVLLAIELLLFEYRPRSIIPVALAASAATGVRMAFDGSEPVFAMTELTQPSGWALAFYILLGGLMGLVSVAVTRAVYAIEDGFEKLPIHWMWWPAIGAVVVGVVGYFAPDTLGVGYYNITDILSNKLPIAAVVFLCAMKFLSWSVALGSGTSGGTLAPLFTIGGGIGLVLGSLAADEWPILAIDPRLAGLVGMAAIFSGASRAMLASAVFAFETTLQPFGLLPLLGGCAAAYLISSLTMRNSIMTEKIARRGVQTPAEYTADSLSRVLVGDVATRKVVTVHPDDIPADVLQRLDADEARGSHQGYPVMDTGGSLVGMVMRRELVRAAGEGRQSVSHLVASPVRYVYDDCTVRQAAEHMVNHRVGRLPVMTRQTPPRLVGILTRSDVLSVLQNQIRDAELQPPTLWLGSGRRRRPGTSESVDRKS